MISGDRLKDARFRAGMTQLQLAAAAGVSIGTISNLERGADHQATDFTLYKIRKALGEHLSEGNEARP